jgi:hypothetical protein
MMSLICLGRVMGRGMERDVADPDAVPLSCVERMRSRWNAERCGLQAFLFGMGLESGEGKRGMGRTHSRDVGLVREAHDSA